MPQVRLFYPLNKIQGVSVDVYMHKYVCMCVYACDGYTYMYVYGVHACMWVCACICMMCVMSVLIYVCVHVYTLCRHMC